MPEAEIKNKFYTPSALAIGAGGFIVPVTPGLAVSTSLAHRKRHV